MATRVYERLVRPVLFGLQPEPAHELAKLALRMSPTRRMAGAYEVHNPRLRTQLAGLPLARPVGLAAGFDKDGDVIDPLQCLGFGYVVVGSIMPGPRRGNAKPRIVRHAEERSLVNCLGLPSKGLAHATARLQARRVHRVPIVANVHGSTADEFAGCVRALEPYVDAIEVSLICPNVDDPALEYLEPAGFERLWGALGRRARRPLLLKLPSYETPAERSMRLELVDLALHLGVAAFTISGTFMRPELGLSMGLGNVSGSPARERALGFVRDLYSVVGRKADIKALGGISSGRDAFDAIAAGATTAELLTGLIYRGPGLARDVNRALAQLMTRHGVPTVDDLRGQDVGAADSRTGCKDVEI